MLRYCALLCYVVLCCVALSSDCESLIAVIALAANQIPDEVSGKRLEDYDDDDNEMQDTSSGIP